MNRNILLFGEKHLAVSKKVNPMLFYTSTTTSSSGSAALSMLMMIIHPSRHINDRECGAFEFAASSQ